MLNKYHELKNKNLLVGICGSLSVLALPSYLTQMKGLFKSVKVVMTHSANKIIPASTIQYLVDEVYAEEFVARKNHVQIARENDIIIVFPATANVLGLAANGLASNFLTSILLAYESNAIFFPNMNLQMWKNAIVKYNVMRLKEFGHCVFEPEKQLAYELASGTYSENIVLPSLDIMLDYILNNYTKSLN